MDCGVVLPSVARVGCYKQLSMSATRELSSFFPISLQSRIVVKLGQTQNQSAKTEKSDHHNYYYYIG